MKFLAFGKVKDIYDLEDGRLLFLFSDRISAYDVKFNEEIPQKGEVLCKFAKFWFDRLSIPNHFIRLESNSGIIVKKMKMLPIECIVRGYFYGSLVNRWKNGAVQLPDNFNPQLASKLPEPLFDPTTKSKNDLPISKKAVIEQGLVSESEFHWLSKTSIKIYQLMTSIAESAGFILADLKLEFGKLDGKLLLGDSIGPDEYRLWPKEGYRIGKKQESFDKQLLRDWLTENGYQKQFEDARKMGKEPIQPRIPEKLIRKITERYISSFERFAKTNS